MATDKTTTSPTLKSLQFHDGYNVLDNNKTRCPLSSCWDFPLPLFPFWSEKAADSLEHASTAVETEANTSQLSDATSDISTSAATLMSIDADPGTIFPTRKSLEDDVAFEPAEKLGDYILPCFFQFLKCDTRFTFNELDGWITHCMSHFWPVGPPDWGYCPICGMWYGMSVDARRTWDSMLSHLSDHFKAGNNFANPKPDYELYTWMWRRRLISDKTYFSLQSGFRGSGAFKNAKIKEEAHIKHEPELYAKTPSPSKETFKSDNFETEPACTNHNQLQVVKKPARLTKASVEFTTGRASLTTVDPGTKTASQRFFSNVGFGEAKDRDRKIENLMDSVFNEIIWDVWFKCQTWLNHATGNGESSSQGYTNGSFHTESGRSTSKRKRSGSQVTGGEQRDPAGPGGGAGGDDQSVRDEKPFKRLGLSSRLRCIYTASDQPNNLSRACLKVASPDMDDLKQYHLKVHHRLTIDQMKVRRGGTEEEKWWRLFCRIFPSWQSEHADRELPSAYADANYQLLQAYSTTARQEANDSENFLVQLDPTFSGIPTVDGDLRLAPWASWEGSLTSSTSSAHLNVLSAPGLTASTPSSNTCPICRCSSHTEACRTQQSDESAELCLCCSNWLPCSAAATSYIRERHDSKICRCRQHESLCLSLRLEYDARKCACCKGWYAWSEQAQPLICAVEADSDGGDHRGPKSPQSLALLPLMDFGNGEQDLGGLIGEADLEPYSLIGESMSAIK